MSERMEERNMNKRILPLLLLCVLLLSVPCLAVSPASAGETVHAAETTADIPDLIDGVRSAYVPDYTYFVAKSDALWVGEDNTDGEITMPCTNKAVGNTHGRFGGLWQSHGFGRLVFYRVFGTYAAYDYHCNPSSLNENVVVVGRLGSQCRELRGRTDALVSETTVKDLMAKAKIGDLIVCAPKNLCSMMGQTMVFLEANDVGVKVYQADYTGSCAVTEQTIPYTTLAAYHCMTVLRASNYPTVDYLAPRPVQQVTLSTVNATHNENVTVTWLPAKYAMSYLVELVNDENQIIFTESVTETSYTLMNMAPDTYTVRITAVNDKGRETTVSEPFTVHPMLHVRFLDHDNTLISQQEVTYGGDATAPTVPSRVGYKFAGWSEGLRNITTDLNIYALYELEHYTVNFYSVGKQKRLDTQQVYYGSPAVLPENVDNSFGLEDGCVFAGWHIEYGSDGTSYEAVDGDMNIIATQTWGHGTLPVTIALNDAVLQEDGKTYKVTGYVQNNTLQPVSFKLVVTLKTSAGKAVKCLVEDEYQVNGKAPAAIADTIIYSEKISSIEYVAVGIRENDKTGGAYSALTAVPKIVASTAWGNWSEWTDTPQTDHDDVETKTQYRYRNKVSTTSSTKTLTDPWTFSHETYTWSSYGSWSGWKSSAITASDAVEVQKRTAYKWFYYLCPYCGGHSYYNQHYTWAGGCGKWIDDSYYRTTWGAAAYSSGQDFHGTGRYYTNNTDAGRAYCWRAWYNGSGGTTQTQYRSRTRSKIYTYHYWKWDEWSQWSDTYTAGTETETRTLYRYRDKVDLSNPNAGTEDTSGKEYRVNGVINLGEGLPTVLDGRYATIMVYKKTNTDPTEAQLEYVGQTRIGEALDENGETIPRSYDFTFRPKEEPSEETGCFIVALGIEGCDKLVNVGVIEPEGITHTVEYYVDGVLYNTQTVNHGTTAELPEIPEKEGYTFVRWSETATAVQSDLKIHAVFQPVAHAVTFIDWETGTIDQQTVLHGETIHYPELEPVTGALDRGWTTRKPVATENLIVESVVIWKTYDVTFRDGSSIISQQKVSHGESASLPAVKPQLIGRSQAQQLRQALSLRSDRGPSPRSFPAQRHGACTQRRNRAKWILQDAGAGKLPQAWGNPPAVRPEFPEEKNRNAKSRRAKLP